MRLENHTNIPDKEVRDMVRFARPPGISGFDIRVSNITPKVKRYYDKAILTEGKEKGFSVRYEKNKSLIAGTAYHKGSSYHSTASPFIVVRFTTYDDLFPAVRKGFKAYLPELFLDRKEALLGVLAHELRHLWQSKVKKGYRVWGSKGQFSERDADAYAIRKTREWRRQHNKPQYEMLELLNK